MSYLHGRPPDIDYTHDWRRAEYELMVTRARDRLDAQQWPSWLSASGNWYEVQLTIEGIPVGPPLAWPNALMIADWLMYER